jgi:hypothetical protein
VFNTLYHPLRDAGTDVRKIGRIACSLNPIEQGVSPITSVQVLKPA